jgi:outer membrane lipoprotein SlyB
MRLLSRTVTLALTGLLIVTLTGCMRNYSPNTYSSAAAQQANKVTQGVVIGYREVMISADGTVGTVTGGAAGGVLGAQTPGSGVTTALGTIGGTLFGGLIGTGIEHAAGDTRAFEYLVRQTDDSLVSVTQKDEQPLPVGEKILVIAGNQARIVRDYSQPLPEPGATAAKGTAPQETPAPAATPLAAPIGTTEAVPAAPKPEETALPAPAEGEAAGTPGSLGQVGPPVKLAPGPSTTSEPVAPTELAPRTEPLPATEETRPIPTE